MYREKLNIIIIPDLFSIVTLCVLQSIGHEGHKLLRGNLVRVVERKIFHFFVLCFV